MMEDSARAGSAEQIDGLDELAELCDLGDPDTYFDFEELIKAEIFKEVHFRARPRAPSWDSLQKGIDRLSKRLRRGFVKRAKLQNAKTELRDTRAELEALQVAHSGVVDTLESLHSNEGPDLVKFAFPPAGGALAQIVSCNRAVLRQWSEPMAVLLRHGNGLGGEEPVEISLQDVDVATFTSILKFKNTGRFDEADVKVTVSHEGFIDGDQEHPVLRFADCYELRDVQAGYVRVMRSVRDIGHYMCLSNGAQYLSIALRYNIPSLLDEAVAAMAFSMDSEYTIGTHRKRNLSQSHFLTLPASAAASVLASDELVLPKKREAEALEFVRKWVQHAPGRASQARELVQSIRFELCSFEELVAIQESLESDTALADSMADVIEALSKAVNSKLATDATPRKRRFMKSEERPEDVERQR